MKRNWSQMILEPENKTPSQIPWTIFAFPACIADSQGMPCDEQSQRYFFELQRRGLKIELWANPDIPDTVYFAVPYHQRQLAERVSQELEQQGQFETGFAAKHAESLFRKHGKQ